MSTQGQWRGNVDGVWYGPDEAGAPGFVNLSATLTGGGSVEASASALVNLTALLSGSGAIVAVGTLLRPTAPAPTETPRYSQALIDHAHWKQLREEDDVILALLQQFVMEEA